MTAPVRSGAVAGWEAGLLITTAPLLRLLSGDQLLALPSLAPPPAASGSAGAGAAALVKSGILPTKDCMKAQEFQFLSALPDDDYNVYMAFKPYNLHARFTPITNRSDYSDTARS